MVRPPQAHRFPALPRQRGQALGDGESRLEAKEQGAVTHITAPLPDKRDAPMTLPLSASDSLNGSLPFAHQHTRRLYSTIDYRELAC